jgi:hypothetical protein
LDMVGLNMCLHPSSQEVMDHEGCHFHPLQVMVRKLP